MCTYKFQCNMAECHYIPVQVFDGIHGQGIRIRMIQLVNVNFILKSRLTSLRTFSATFTARFTGSDTFNSNRMIWTVKHWKVKVWQIKINSPNSPMFSTANVSHYTLYLSKYCITCFLTGSYFG